MKYQLSFLIPILLSFLPACKKPENAPEKGVSYELNLDRKNNISNISYQLELNIPSEKNQVIEGKNTILFELKSTDHELVVDFNTDSSHIKQVQKNGEPIPYSYENEHIIISSEYLETGSNKIEISFVAGDLSLNRNADYLYTLFVPDRASTCFPLFDQPNLKASYQLKLTTPDSWEAVSNGRLIRKKDENKKSIYEFDKTKPISSYLFAFAAGKFSKATQKLDGHEMTMYYRETDSEKVNRNRDEIFKLHAKSRTWLEEYTAIAYPFGKFDFVLIPSFQYGGMEHPGSIFYNESALMLDENATVNKRMARASVIAHETAHMWFGDLVTMDWFNDVWLKEVFANFMAAKIVHPSFPEINHKLRFLLAHYPAAYAIDRSKGTNPILQDLTNLKNAGTLYGPIIYQKAPIVMRQLEMKIGEKLMQESLSEYLKTFSFGNAKWDDLVKIIDKRTPEDIFKWSDVWVKTAGMPAYDGSLTNGIYVIRQQHDTVSNRVWLQSFDLSWNKNNSYTDSAVVTSAVTPDIVIETASNPIFPNPDGTGYGYFKMDSVGRAYFLDHYTDSTTAPFSDPVFRGSMLVNIWEGFVRNAGPKPIAYTEAILKMLQTEQNPLLVDYLLNNLEKIWWSFLSETSRNQLQISLENELWKQLTTTKNQGIQSAFFHSYISLASSNQGLKNLTELWNNQLNIKGLVISEDDYISLACQLALHQGDKASAILSEQLSKTKNPDRKQRLEFVIPSLGPEADKRDAFFESLKDEKNREKEAWVLSALSYLHHPSRQKTSLKYIRPSLDLLQEIQLTGDIFFPGRWLDNTLGDYSSPEAVSVVNRFLEEHPDYPYFLKNKILNSSDMMNRAVGMKQ